MNNHAKWKSTTGFTLVITLLQKYFLTLGHECNAYNFEGTFYANCSNRDLKEVPSTLPIAIDILLLNDNRMMNLYDNSFNNYLNLWRIEITNLKPTRYSHQYTVQRNTFKPLQKLKYLDITSAGYGDKDKFNLPSHLEIFIFIQNKYYNFDLSSGVELQNVTGDGNFLTNIPRFHLSAPLTILSLKDMTMDKMTVSDLAPLCKLKEFYVNLPEKSLLRQPESFCECRRIEAWLLKFNINGSIPLGCSSTAGTTNCDTTFDKSLLTIRDECMGITKHLSDAILMKLIISSLIMSVILIIASVIILYVLRAKRKIITPGTTSEQGENEDGDEEFTVTEDQEAEQEAETEDYNEMVSWRERKKEKALKRSNNLPVFRKFP